MSELVRVGQSVKVHLPGESLWVTVLQITEHNLLLGRIDNTPIGSLHNYKYGSIETFHLVDYGFAKCWEPSPHRKLDSSLKIVGEESCYDCPKEEKAINFEVKEVLDIYNCHCSLENLARVNLGGSEEEKAEGELSV